MRNLAGKKVTRFKEKDLPDGKYAFTYEVTDITGRARCRALPS